VWASPCRCWWLQYRAFLPPAPQTLPQLFSVLRGVSSDFDATFVVYQNERYSRGRVFAEAAALSRHLVAVHGVTKGDRVAVAMRNLPEFVVAFIAVADVGGVITPLNSWWTVRPCLCADLARRVALSSTV
jgi:acyl-coenzyme A synthetase/AMP-(fatty) acid ligase